MAKNSLFRRRIQPAERRFLKGLAVNVTLFARVMGRFMVEGFTVVAVNSTVEHIRELR